MTAPDLQRIGREMAEGAADVPIQNRPKYDREARDVFNAIKLALEAGDFARVDRLAQYWNDRRAAFIALPVCFKAPPCLVRRTGESIRDYINRCIDRKGK